MKVGGKNCDIHFLDPLICFVLLFYSLFCFFPLHLLPCFLSFPLPAHLKKKKKKQADYAANLSCRTNHFSESVQIEPAERQERIPTESQKEKEGERLKKRNESTLQAERKRLRGQGKTTPRRRRKERETASNGGEGQVAAFFFRAGRQKGGKEIFGTA